jgi:hypothetical protein
MRTLSKPFSLANPDYRSDFQAWVKDFGPILTPRAFQLAFYHSLFVTKVPTMQRKAFVLLSGGLDSTTCLYKAIYDYAPQDLVHGYGDPELVKSKSTGLKRSLLTTVSVIPRSWNMLKLLVIVLALSTPSSILAHSSAARPLCYLATQSVLWKSLTSTTRTLKVCPRRTSRSVTA